MDEGEIATRIRAAIRSLILDQWELAALDVGERRLAEPDVGQFVSEGEDLSGLWIGPVDEHHCRVRVREGEASELVRIQLAVRVGADDPTDHHEHAGGLRILSEPGERRIPTVEALPSLDRPIENHTHLVDDVRRWSPESGIAYEVERRFTIE